MIDLLPPLFTPARKLGTRTAPIVSEFWIKIIEHSRVTSLTASVGRKTEIVNSGSNFKTIFIPLRILIEGDAEMQVG